MTYNVYSGSSCSGGTTDSDIVAVTMGVVANSKSFTFASAGTFSFQAVYSGDANNNPATSACETELLFVGPNPMTVTTSLSQSIINVGDSVTDEAFLAGATLDTAGGTVTYSVFSGPSCAGPALDTDTVTVASGNVPESKSFTFTSAGTFSFLAVYSGDTNHNGATSVCGTEILTVNEAPSIGMMGSSIFRWDGIHWHHYETLPSPNTLLGVFMLDTNDGWAVGTAKDATSPPVILRWNGVSWVVKTPPGVALGGTLMDVHALSPTEAWAVGFGPAFGVGNPPPILKWDGAIWTSVPSGLASGVLTDVHMLSSTDGWAVGCKTMACAQGDAVILRWNGLAWSSVTVPENTMIAGLLDVFMLTPANGWAVGLEGTIIHWDGAQWRRAPAPPNAFLTSVHMVSPTDGWAVGYDTQTNLSLILRWDGLTWNVVSTAPVPPTMSNVLTSVFMVSSLDGWIISGYTFAPNVPGFGAGSGLFLHYGPRVIPETVTSTLTSISTETSTVGTSQGLGIPGAGIVFVLVGLMVGVAVLVVLAALLRRPRLRLVVRA